MRVSGFNYEIQEPPSLEYNVSVQPEIYFQAASRLFGNPRIEKSWQDCFNLSQTSIFPRIISASILFDPGLGVVESVVDATAEKSEPISQKNNPYSPGPRGHDHGHRRSGGKAQIYNLRAPWGTTRCPGSWAWTSALRMTPCLAINLIMGGQYLGVAALTNYAGHPLHPPAR